MTPEEKFLNLPIIFEETEYGPDGWSRKIERVGTMAEIVSTWGLDDPSEKYEFTQVLRYLRASIAGELQ